MHAIDLLDADDEERRLVDCEAERLHAELAVGVAGVVEVGVEVEVGPEEYDWKFKKLSIS